MSRQWRHSRTQEQAAETLQRYFSFDDFVPVAEAKAALAVLVERNQRLEVVAETARQFEALFPQPRTPAAPTWTEHMELIDALAALDAEEPGE